MPTPVSLDPEAIKNLRALSPDDDGAFLGELIGIYLNDTPERIAEMETALAAGDAPTLTRAAHTIKSSSENFGATALAALGRKIEDLGRKGDLTPVGPLVPDLKARFAETKQALESLAKSPA